MSRDIWYCTVDADGGHDPCGVVWDSGNEYDAYDAGMWNMLFDTEYIARTPVLCRPCSAMTAKRSCRSASRPRASMRAARAERILTWLPVRGYSQDASLRLDSHTGLLCSFICTALFAVSTRSYQGRVLICVSSSPHQPFDFPRVFKVFHCCAYMIGPVAPVGPAAPVGPCMGEAVRAPCIFAFRES